MTASDNEKFNPLTDFEDDKLAKKQLLLDTILTKSETSDDELLQKMYLAAKNGGSLEASVIAGGATNYSYKVTIDDHRVFAKICFERALWNPDATVFYDLQRTLNEYLVMKKIHARSPDCVVRPIACWDLKTDEGQKIKILITEYAASDEQSASQHIDGRVDPRWAPKLANTLATLNLMDGFAPEFNEQVKPCMESIMDLALTTTEEISRSSDSKDRTQKYIAEYPASVLETLQDGIANYHKKECLCHADSHSLNILVEAKPSNDEPEEFGPDGSMTLVDWEMVYQGPMGKDIGLAMIMPLACMIYHALNGQSEGVESNQTMIETLIRVYLKRMREAGKSEAEVAAILRNVSAWAGFRSYLVFYIISLDAFGEATEQQKKHLRDAMGILPLKLMRLAFDDNVAPQEADAEEVLARMNALVKEELTLASSVFVGSSSEFGHRRSSLVRTKSRRISDASLRFKAAEEAVRRLSVSGHSRRLSSFEGITEPKTKSLAEPRLSVSVKTGC